MCLMILAWYSSSTSTLWKGVAFLKHFTDCPSIFNLGFPDCTSRLSCFFLETQCNRGKDCRSQGNFTDWHHTWWILSVRTSWFGCCLLKHKYIFILKTVWSKGVGMIQPCTKCWSRAVFSMSHRHKIYRLTTISKNVFFSELKVLF